MAREDADALTLKGVPYVARPVVITTEKDTTRDRECDGGDTAQDVVVREGVKLAVSTDIEKTARCVIGTRCKSVSVREEAEAASVLCNATSVRFLLT